MTKSDFVFEYFLPLLLLLLIALGSIGLISGVARETEAKEWMAACKAYCLPDANPAKDVFDTKVCRCDTVPK
jgi:hypothetical protein